MRPRVRDVLLLTLTAAAGSVDAISYLGLGRVFTANMTGNLVLLGIATGQSQLGGALRSVLALAGFAGGVLVGVRLTEGIPSPASRSPFPARRAWSGLGHGGDVWPRSVTVALLVELGLLVGFLWGWEIVGDRPASLPLDILVALSAGAMGIQAAAARRLNVVGVTTVFVTGMLTSLIADLSTLRPGGAHWILWATSLISLVIGAAVGAAVFITWRPAAPLVAVLLIGIVLAAATFLGRRGDQGLFGAPSRTRQ